MKITMYELLGMIKDGKAPKKIKYKYKKYNFDDDGIYTKKIIADLLFECNYNLNDEVEILEEKKIPEKLDEYADVSGNLACEWSFAEKKLKDKMNEIIDYLDYLKSKGDE